MTYDETPHRDSPDSVPADGARLERPTPRSLLLPSTVGSWGFCIPARPAPSLAADPAWLAFLGVEPPDTRGLDPAWVAYLRR